MISVPNWSCLLAAPFWLVGWFGFICFVGWWWLLFCCCFVVVLLFAWSFLFVCFVFTDLHEAPRVFFRSLKKQLFSIWTVLFPSDLNMHLLLLNTFFLFFYDVSFNCSLNYYFLQQQIFRICALLEKTSCNAVCKMNY